MLIYSLNLFLLLIKSLRIAGISWHPNSFQWTTRMVRGSTHYAKPIIFEGWISYASSAMALYEDHTLLLWIANIISTTSPAPCVQPSLARRTATTSMTGKSSAISITQHSLHNDATDAKQRFSSNLWKYSEMGRISIGILSVT